MTDYVKYNGVHFENEPLLSYFLENFNSMSGDDFIQMLEKALEQWGVDAKAGAVIVSGATLVCAIVKSGKLNKNQIKCAVEKCIHHYDTYPVLMTALGAAISVALLYDSCNDYSNIQTKRERFEIGLLVPPDQQPRYWNNLRDEILYMRKRQAAMGVLKLIAMVTFGYVAYASSAPTSFRAIMWASSATCGAAATIDIYSAYQFNVLLKRLDEDGRLIT